MHSSMLKHATKKNVVQDGRSIPRVILETVRNSVLIPKPKFIKWILEIVWSYTRPVSRRCIAYFEYFSPLFPPPTIRSFCSVDRFSSFLSSETTFVSQPIYLLSLEEWSPMSFLKFIYNNLFIYKQLGYFLY